MSEASSIRTRTFEQMKDDPLYSAWAEAEKDYRKSIDRYSKDYTKAVEEASEQIRKRLAAEWGPVLGFKLDTVKVAFDAYANVYKEHPPNFEK